MNIRPNNIHYIAGKYSYAHIISFYANVKYIDDEKDDEKITVNFIKPGKKTKFECVNVVDSITYCGRIDKFDVLPSNVTTWRIAKFYVAHDNLDRFRKIYESGGERWYDQELFLYALLMRPMPIKTFSYLLNHQITGAFVPQITEFLMCMVELKIPQDIWKMIVNIHIDMFLGQKIWRLND
jgi:hypothetical protein